MKHLKKILLIIGLVCLFAAGCSVPEATYTFQTNGGQTIEAVEIEKGEEYTLPIPVREGYSFEGWYTNAEFSGDPIEKVVAGEEDVTYYAKWEQMYLVTLNPDGGTLSQTSVYLKAGENVYDAVQQCIPQKSGVEFGAWFNGNVELSKTMKMPKKELSLKAKYKVAYTVEFYLQDSTNPTEYIKSEETVTGSHYVGENFESEQQLTGFEEVYFAKGENERYETVNQLTLSEGSENVFKHYFNRLTFKVTFNPNYPDGTETETTSLSVLYGEEVEVPWNYTSEGYCFVGWTTSKSGNVIYEANFLEKVLYNGDSSEEIEPLSFEPERTMTLYGVWKQGYTDLFGCSDYIYLFDEEGDEIYLSRGDQFFKGEYKSSTKAFTFLTYDEYDSEVVLLTGKIVGDSVYCYSSVDRGALSYTLYDGEALAENVNIYLDSYNGITYSVEENGTTTESEGTYFIDDEGYYVANFTSGELADSELVFIVGAIGTTNAFQLRNEEEYSLGRIVRFALNEGSLVSFKEEYYSLSLNGFGIATYYVGEQEQYFYYDLNKETNILTLMSVTTYQTVEVARIFEYSGLLGYMTYDQNYDHEFETENGGKLKLDGCYAATYTVGTTVINGNYYVSGESIFGGTLVTLSVSNGESYLFMLETKTEDVPVLGDDNTETGETESVITYIATEKAKGYAEYYYLSEGRIYYAPLIVLNEPMVGFATLYGYTDKEEYVKISYGLYEYDDLTKTYVYTVEGTYTEEYSGVLGTDPLDLFTLASVKFAVDTQNTGYPVNYWYEYTYKGESNKPERVITYDSVTYTQKDGSGELTLILSTSLAIYKANGEVYDCVYAEENGLTTLKYNYDSSSYYFYFEIDKEEGVFVLLTDQPDTKGYVVENGVVSENVLTFDGRGGAVYAESIQVEGQEPTEKVYSGTVVDAGKKTEYGYVVYQFTGKNVADESDTVMFEYIRYASQYLYIFVYSQVYNGEYQSEKGEELVLDGFGYSATYTNVYGVEFDGMYAVSEENVVQFFYNDATLYFDLKTDKAFTLRGSEYGTYLLMRNQNIGDILIDFNGYNSFSMYTYEKLSDGTYSDEKTYITENGTYTIDGDLVTLTYQVGTNELTLVGELSLYMYSNSSYLRVFIVSNLEGKEVRSYVNSDDWSVLILDEIGNATKYDANGNKEYGTYTLITENLLYYVNNAGTDACVYVYDYVTGEITPKDETTRGYYTEALESLVFMEYGYAIFNGTDRYYYNVENSNVVIYEYDPENEDANDYGFVSKDFGTFSDTKEWDADGDGVNEVYYYNGGYRLSFNRKAGTENDYKIPVNSGTTSSYYALEDIEFTPSGEEEFSVSADFYLNGTEYENHAYVVREVDEEGNAQMYLLLYPNSSYNSYYRFDLTVNYKGVDPELGTALNTYEITAMKFVKPSLSYYYMYYSYMSSIFGGTVDNTFGALTFVQEKNADGTDGDFYAIGEFGVSSGMYDSLGNIVSFEKAPIETINEAYSLYRMTVIAQDGYTYYMDAQVQYQSSFGAYVYRLYAFLREETLSIENTNYKVKVERVIWSEVGLAEGGIYDINLYQVTQEGEETVETLIEYYTRVSPESNVVWYITRTVDDETDKITSSTYYIVTLSEKSSGGEVEEEQKFLPVYEKAEVEVLSVTTVYNEDGTSYLDMDSNNTIKIVSLAGSLYVVRTCEYDSENDFYTITIYKHNAEEGVTVSVAYEVKITEGVASIVEVLEESETSNEEDPSQEG